MSNIIVILLGAYVSSLLILFGLIGKVAKRLHKVFENHGVPYDRSGYDLAFGDAIVLFMIAPFFVPFLFFITTQKRWELELGMAHATLTALAEKESITWRDAQKAQRLYVKTYLPAPEPS